MFAVSAPLFPNAEVAENHVENVFDIDAAGEAPERERRQAQFLGQDIVAAGAVGERAGERSRRVRERETLPLARHQRRLTRFELFARKHSQAAEKIFHALAGRRREREEEVIRPVDLVTRTLFGRLISRGGRLI
jgi:hypothetical protein